MSTIASHKTFAANISDSETVRDRDLVQQESCAIAKMTARSAI